MLCLNNKKDELNGAERMTRKGIFLVCLCSQGNNTPYYFKEADRLPNCKCDTAGYYFLSLDEDEKERLLSLGSPAPVISSQTFTK